MFVQLPKVHAAVRFFGLTRAAAGRIFAVPPIQSIVRKLRLTRSASSTSN